MARLRYINKLIVLRTLEPGYLFVHQVHVSSGRGYLSLLPFVIWLVLISMATNGVVDNVNVE